MISLSSVILLWESYLSKQLAGAAALDPTAVLPMIDRLNAEDISNECARIYLMKLSTMLDDFRSMSWEQRVEISVKVAFDLGYQIDYADWLLLATQDGIPAVDLAGECIKKIMRLAVLHDGLEELQEFAAQLVRDYGWGNEEERLKAAKEILYDGSH